MNNAATNFRDAMAENALQLVLSQSHFERSLFVCPAGREDEKRAITGVFAEDALGGVLGGTMATESTSMSATLQVLEAEDIQAKDTVLVGTDTWVVLGQLSSDGYLKTMSLSKKNITRHRAAERR